MAKTGKTYLTARVLKLEVHSDYGQHQLAVEPLDAYVELEVNESDIIRSNQSQGVVLTLRGAARILSLMLDQIEDANQTRTQDRVSRVQGKMK